MATHEPFDFFIQWHLTERCNLHCRHCYQDRPGTGELELAEVRRTAGEAADMIRDWSDAYGIGFQASMNVTGGEPFLRQDLFTILEEIKRQGFAIHLLTNGTLIDRARAQALARLGVAGVQVSIEGPEDVHDAIRGPGSFAASARGIEHLAASGIAVTLNVTLSRLNAGAVDRIIAFGVRSGAARIGFSRLVPSGEGRNLFASLLTAEQLARLYPALLSGRTEPVSIVTGDPVAAQLKREAAEDAGNTAISGCAAALAGLTIDPNGILFPCRRLPVPMGNVRTDSLREIWASSPVLEALRDRNRYTGKCGRCRRWALCRGCRAIAYAWSASTGLADFLADDPQCFLEP